VRTYAGQSKLDKLRLQKGERLRVEAQDCGLTLSGPFALLHLRGKSNFVKVIDRVDRLEIEGEQNTVECDQMPGHISLRGRGQRVKISEHPGSVRPQVEVQGTDQAVTYRHP